MLYVDQDETGLERYMVTNDQGLCLIRTTSRAIAHFVNENSRGISPDMFLLVGGDRGSRLRNPKLFHHIRRVVR